MNRFTSAWVLLGLACWAGAVQGQGSGRAPETPRPAANAGGLGAPDLPSAVEVAPTPSQVAQSGQDEARFLARALNLEDAPVTAYGWIQNSYTATPGFEPANRSTVTVFPNRLANEWQGNQYYLVVEKPTGRGELSLGFRLDTLFGNDWLFTRSFGLFDGAFTPRGFAGLDFPQIYGEAHLPILTEGGITLKGGRFYSPAGFESVMAVNRPLLSVPYLLNFTPFTFFGALASAKLNDRLAVFSGAVNGADRWINANYHYSYLGGVNWNAADGRTTFTSVVLVGPNQLPFFPSTDLAKIPNLPVGVFTTPALQNRRNPYYLRSTLVYFSNLVTRKWNARLTEAAEVAFVTEGNVLGLGPGGALARGEYYGFAHHLLYEFDPRLTGVFRAEIFRDDDGLALGIADTFHELTVGLIGKPRPWLWVRPEIRYDWARSTHPYDDGTRSSQITLAVDLILRF